MILLEREYPNITIRAESYSYRNGTEGGGTGYKLIAQVTGVTYEQDVYSMKRVMGWLCGTPEPLTEEEATQFLYDSGLAEYLLCKAIQA